ncbi:hypothetical protein [Streptomonospora wellingtoniae]|uniref:Uncharacterized protein n=1 Tax=Streptomonospora wellingtoniae TaxID=3075544 RepID=A0ABU2KW80_9ACTN|nr:hypothetical protein [Streptomonospora sp. DSM 45055]MDT0303550.1 hypothetical protein [Streptomonospora sp. DSM 45055]
MVLILLVGGATVGLASVGADRVPFTARESGLADHTLPTLLYCGLLTLLDTYFGWCVLPVLLGYGAARSARQAAGVGAAFAVVALTVYTVGSHLAQVADARAWAARDRPFPSPISEPSVLDTAVGLVLSPLLPIAVAGAVLGALAGYRARRCPLLMLVLVAAIALDMWRRADTPWLSVANGLANVLLVAAGIAVIAWTVAAAISTNRRVPGAPSGEPVKPVPVRLKDARGRRSC